MLNEQIVINPEPKEQKSSLSLKKGATLHHFNNLKHDITTFITDGCLYVAADKIKKYITNIENQIYIIHKAITETSDENINEIFEEFKFNIIYNPPSSIFNDYSIKFKNLNSSIYKAFLALHEIYYDYTRYNSRLQEFTYKIEAPSDILENNLVSFIDSKSINNKAIINHFHSNIYMFLIRNLYNPNFSSTQKRCLYFHNKSISNYVQSIFDVYNEFAKFIKNNKTTNNIFARFIKNNKTTNNIFQKSIDKFNDILETNIYIEDINIDRYHYKDLYNDIYKNIQDIIKHIKTTLLPKIIEEFKYLNDLYLPQQANAAKYFRMGFRTTRRGGNADTIDYTYNNKTYNRKIRYDGKKKYIIINKSKIYLKKS